MVKDAADGDPAATPGVLGVGDRLKEIVLTPLRQLSFWKMKDRARQLGEIAGHKLLRAMMFAAPTAKFHLMGHSFGCIVVSASVAGASDAEPLPKPVDTLFLVQGALSIWAYTSDIPYAPGTAGYFKRIAADRLVSGPIVTTRSRFDRAVGFFYPLGAGSARQIVLGAEDYPPYGGLGAFGIQAVGGAQDRTILPVTSSYDFEVGRVYNIEASDVIKNGGGASGAHSDIAHPEVAHAFWEAARVGLSTMPSPAVSDSGGLLGADSPDRGRRERPKKSGTKKHAASNVYRQQGLQQRDKGGEGQRYQQQQQQGSDGQAYQQQQQQQRQQGGEGQRYQQQQQQGSDGQAYQQQQQQQRQQGGEGQRYQQQQQQGSDGQAYQQQQQQQRRQGGEGQRYQQQQQQGSDGQAYQQQQQQQRRQGGEGQRYQQQQPNAQVQRQDVEAGGAPASSGAKQVEGPQSPAQRPDQRRWINAEVEGHPRGKSLRAGNRYNLTFDVDTEQRDAAVGAALDDSQIFAPGAEEATLTVQLDSADFAIDKSADSLTVPRAGKSTRNASFKITPRHNGASKMTATIHLEGNFIQQMELSFDVGAAGSSEVEIEALGRPLSAVAVVQPRDIGLTILPGVGGYEVIVRGSVAAYARLPILPAELAKAVDVARDELMKVVMWRDADGKYAFQSDIKIPDAARQFALRTMARAGATLFRRLFWGPSAAADANRVGEFLRKMASETPKLKVQIVTASAPIPWGMLYFGDASEGAKLDWDNFLGMRHVIEMIPLQNTLVVSAPEIPSDQPKLALSVNVNRGIDEQMRVNLVAQQETYWGDANKLGSVRVISRTTKAELVKALASGSAEDQILYFYCHAKSADLASSGGPDSASLVLSDGSVTLGDLNLDAPTTAQLRNSPLVFINACESAEMSPAFYDGFVPYFMAKGARGVIGTECKTPALFAAEWAKRFFFEHFLKGETLGEAFLALRREFLEQHGNPLGLLYAVHSDGDTRVAPPLALAS